MFSIDLRESIIPFCLLLIVNQFKRMTTGEMIEVLDITEKTITDLKNVLPAGEYKIIRMERMRSESPGFRLGIEKIAPRQRR